MRWIPLVIVAAALLVGCADQTVTRDEAIEALADTPYEIRYRDVPGDTLSGVAVDEDGVELDFQVRFGQEALTDPRGPLLPGGLTGQGVGMAGIWWLTGETPDRRQRDMALDLDLALSDRAPDYQGVH